MIEGKKIITKDINDEELIWSELNSVAIKLGLVADELPDNVLQPFINAFKELRKSCYVNLTLPKMHSSSDGTFIDEIIRAFKLDRP